MDETKTDIPPEPPTPEPKKGILVGYARVSMSDQNNQRQIDEMIRYGVHKDDIFLDNASGKSMARPGFGAMMKDIREGDTLVVVSIDRLGRNVIQVLLLINDLCKRGIDLKILGSDLDVKTPNGRMMVGILCSLAQWEREQIVERTQHGIDRAKERGVVGGRPPKVTADMVKRAVERTKKGEALTDIAIEFKVHKNTLYRRVEQYRQAQRHKAAKEKAGE